MTMPCKKSGKAKENLKNKKSRAELFCQWTENELQRFKRRFAMKKIYLKNEIITDSGKK